MNKNYSSNTEQTEKGPVQRQSPTFRSLSDAWFLAIILLILLFISFVSEAQTYPSSFSHVLITNGISSPTNMEFAPDGRLFVAQQNGQLRVIKNGVLLTKPFISLNVDQSGERGLLGIAFHPSFNSNHYIYLYYTLSSGANNRVSRFTASGDTVVPGSEVLVLDFDPLAIATNHNGGTIHFGPDGKLYVAMGDNANNNHAQNLSTYHGKLLRINSDGTIPTGNPFTTGSAQQKRIWSYGLRNPFTFCFQPGTGKLFINDVGEFDWEEINDATTGGRNFGWSNEEGVSGNPSYTDPVYAYAHGTGVGIGCAITGGTFFNPASTIYPSSYTGKYFFLEYCQKWIDMLTFNGTTWTRSNFASNLPGHPVAITTGPDGNLYFLSRDNSALYKIVYTTSNTFEPLADSYVRSGTNANTNYGTSTLLQARKAANTSNNDQRIYLRFSLANIGTSIGNAKLRLYGNMNASTPPSVNVDVRNSNNLTWQENTLTYNNMPAPQSTVYGTKTISGTTAQYYEWDLTTLIQLRKNAGATSVTLVLRCSTNVSANFVKFNSKEAASNKPQLIITSSSDFAASENDYLKPASGLPDNTSADNTVTIFPNPAADQITLQLVSEQENSILKIVDLNGRLCREEFINPGDNIISTKNLLNGIYTLTVESKEGTIRKKLQIIK
ncbi:MAG TPA: PQQ-dependent sugar dehydrogenase [Bacteroidia bacterium]|nr:PQQ-dependent sugar dehydrogenase [Bacteroidia bacterium]